MIRASRLVFCQMFKTGVGTWWRSTSGFGWNKYNKARGKTCEAWKPRIVKDLEVCVISSSPRLLAPAWPYKKTATNSTPSLTFTKTNYIRWPEIHRQWCCHDDSMSFKNTNAGISVYRIYPSIWCNSYLKPFPVIRQAWDPDPPSWRHRSATKLREGWQIGRHQTSSIVRPCFEMLLDTDVNVIISSYFYIFLNIHLSYIGIHHALFYRLHHIWLLYFMIISRLHSIGQVVWSISKAK